MDHSARLNPRSLDGFQSLSIVGDFINQVSKEIGPARLRLVSTLDAGEAQPLQQSVLCVAPFTVEKMTAAAHEMALGILASSCTKCMEMSHPVGVVGFCVNLLVHGLVMRAVGSYGFDENGARAVMRFDVLLGGS